MNLRTGGTRRQRAVSEAAGAGGDRAPGGEGSGAATGERADRRLAWLLIVCCVAQFMVILDLSIVNVALPSIQSSLGFSAIGLQWVVDAYAIVFAGFLMLGGRASDRFGQRRTLVVALVAFALASLAGGSAPDQTVLVLARGLQGLSGALMAAGSLAAITSSFPAGPARHRAIGLWGAMNGAGGAAGSLLGGVITQELGWRWVLLINPPIGIAAAAVALYVIVDRPSEKGARFDLAGALTLTVGLVALVYGIVNAGYLGWDAPVSILPLVAGLGLLAAFPVIELRFAKAPLVPLRALTGPLRTANAVVLLFSAALFPMWYVSSLYLQQVLGLSPLQAGLVFLPMALVIMVAARQAGRIVGRFGVRQVLGAGLVMMAAGLLLLARIGASGSAVGFVVLPGVLVAIGIGLSVVPSTIAATHGARPEQAGLASGLVNTSRQVGGALGIALLISLATAYTSHLIGQGHPASLALTDGFRVAYLVGAGLCAAAAVVAFRLLPDAHPVRVAKARARMALPAVVLVVLAGFGGVDFGAAGGPGAPLGQYTTSGAYTFVTEPGLHPPKVKALKMSPASSLAPGYIMMANFYDLTHKPMVGQSGPLILDSNLQPVWFHPIPKDFVASNLNVQTYEGKPALSWWQGVVTSTGATERGEDVVVNDHYKVVATLKGADGWIITLHSMHIVGHDAWVTANKNIPMNLTKYGGVKDGVFVDSAVQEYNLLTGRLVRSWDAYKHIPLSDSYANPPTNGFPWDAYHVNSISLEPGGSFLVSMRNTWAAYQVRMPSGRIAWTLGGKHSSFSIPSAAKFRWQHDVVMQSPNEVSMFDDNCCEITGAGTYLHAVGPSRGLVLRLDRADHKATLTAQYLHGKNFDAAYMGNLQLLPDGHVFVGWGAEPYFSEFSSSGKLLLDAVLPGPDLSYRATLHNWVGLPLYRPKGAARLVDGRLTVYASWNGATQVVAWRVLAAKSGSSSLRPVMRVPKSGFESAVSLGGHYARSAAFELQALNAKGKVIGTSREFSLPR